MRAGQIDPSAPRSAIPIALLFIEPGSYRGDGAAAVVRVPIPVPEPSTWAMMLAGFTGLGAMALRRKRKFTRP
jgi:hypothetical protein